MLPALGSTGVPGLDPILMGGLATERLYPVQGDLGVNTTSLDLQFRFDDAAREVRWLSITCSETRAEPGSVGRACEWSLGDIDAFEPRASQQAVDNQPAAALLHLSEIELAAVTGGVLPAVQKVRPRRLILDSLAELSHRTIDVGCTASLVGGRGDICDDTHFETMTHGVVALHRVSPECGAAEAAGGGEWGGGGGGGGAPGRGNGSARAANPSTSLWLLAAGRVGRAGQRVT